ncbi:hypothetical protein J2T13_004721 [Paenibacillus sp. DS2015]|uniref:S-layer homology domain-containing protein n=1 Tax=Paenibacillus sp. DS2015 TaxID=3373917 RepID=UPI003D198F00
MNTSNLQSKKSEAVLATPLNTLAPAVPTNVVAVSGDLVAMITWDANTESDLAGYKIYRDGGSFHANAEVTRAEFATMLVKALGLETSSSTNFNDTKGHWAADANATLRSIGIINGYGDGSFKPNQSISRGNSSITLKIIKQDSTYKSQ